MRSDFSKRVVLITGAARGIGRAIATAFFELGASVAVADLDAKGAGQAALALDSSGQRALGLEADVGDPNQVERMVDATVERFGGLDFAVNNAGILGPVGPAIELDVEDFDRILRVNVLGVWLSMKHEIAAMSQRGQGVIVNVASINGLRGARNCAAYSASKFAVVGLSKSAALDLAPLGIRVNALCPGAFATELLKQSFPDGTDALVAQTPLARLGALDEIGRAAAFLCSQDASFMTGHALVVDGGVLA